MQISFWDCEYGDSESYDNADYYIYYCLHPKGGKYCMLDNKWYGEKQNCELLDMDKIDES